MGNQWRCGFCQLLFNDGCGNVGKDILIHNGDYNNSGTYYRVGVDVNFLGKDPDKTCFSLAFEQGILLSNESVIMLMPSTLILSDTTNSSNINASGNWGEITTGLRVKVWKGLWNGLHRTHEISPKVHSSPNFVTYDMPGYGVIQNNPWWV